ncbi:MAG TPA: sulfite exporter TauE/SafE family protein [Terriglobales bacterium]|jgi:high-affinity nickel-transport protein
MFGLLSIIAIGFFLGMRHATDPDHVIAVSTIVSRQRNWRRAAMIGAYWGLGHTLTIFVVGSAIILFNVVIPARLGLAMELSVGFMLILLGTWNLLGFMRALPSTEHGPAHSHSHSHGDFIHTHAHSHTPEIHAHSENDNPVARLDRRLGKSGFYQALRPLIIGVVHGLAGSAAIALLILASIRNPAWAIAYLLVFGVGTIAGMMLITMSIASALHFAGSRFQVFGRRLALVSGLVSVAFGAFLAYQICVVQGIFGSSPNWAPR